MKESSAAVSLLRQIEESAGSGYLNRAHQRSFSFNVFQMNAIELMEAAHRIKDPDQGMALMMEKNREAGRQAHREINRHVHNFVSSALTLVEHTRGFMRKHYDGTPLLATYEEQVTTTFAQSPVAQFVQGLRNYMLHRGLPNSSMFMKFASHPEVTDGSGVMETGVHYDTASLLEWDRWSPLARSYLEHIGEHLDLYEFAQEYLALVNQFHGFLDAILAEYHQYDLEELGLLQKKLHAIQTTSQPIPVSSIETSDLASEAPFSFTSKQTTEIGQISSSLVGKIRELHFQHGTQGFPSERPTVELTDSDLIGPVTMWGQESSGERAFMFIRRDGKSYGLLERDYSQLDKLIDTVMKSTWARSYLSREFVEKNFCDWARQQFGSDELLFSESLSKAAQESVTTLEVWAPIANFEIEHSFDFGPVRIESITAAVMEDLRSKALSNRSDDQVDKLFEKLRHEIQGYAAVVVPVKAEAELAEERGLRIAQDVMGLLRFFSPAGPRSYLFSPIELVGAEYIPQSKLIVIRGDSFILNQRLLPQKIGYWNLSSKAISRLGDDLFKIAASLVMPEGLSEFALAVRASILTYSKGTTLVDSVDRLRNCISAIEGVLLKHEMEPRTYSIANRIGSLLALKGSDFEAVRQIVRQIYWLQNQPQLTEQGRHEDELIMQFTLHAHDVLCAVLRNVSLFTSKDQFVSGVDRFGLSLK